MVRGTTWFVNVPCIGRSAAEEICSALKEFATSDVREIEIRFVGGEYVVQFGIISDRVAPF